MKLSVPFNGQQDLLERINKEKVAEIYGKLTHDFIGGGRPSCTNPYVSKNKVVACVKEAHRLGIEFNYLLNASCLGNLEWTRAGQNKIRNFLDWLGRSGVDNITIAVPYLAELLRKSYPNFKITVSNMAQVNSVRKAKQWEELGVDEITLFDTDVNRNFFLLRAIKKEVKCKIKLIVNEDCLAHCLNYSYHSNVSAHSSKDAESSLLVDYYRLSCRLSRIIEPSNFIRAAWIRPEDTHCYEEEIGVDMFKIINRAMTTAAIVNIVKAYTNKRYEGNLYDLLPHPSINLLVNKPNLINSIKYFFKPFRVNMFELYKAREVMTDLDVYIDNQALDNFINFFLKNDCDLTSCDDCGYCREIADKAVKIDCSSQRDAALLHNKFLDKLVSGGMFKYW